MGISDKEVALIIKAYKDGTGIEDTLTALQKLDAQGKTTGKGMGDLAGIFKGLLPALSAAAVVAAFKGMADEAIESERETRILTQTIKNLGLENKVTAGSVQEFANQMMALTGVSDEEVIRSFNSLLKVTKDSQASFDLVKLAMDMSAGSGKSLSETTDTLSLAILGNTRGLRQYGIEVGSGISVTDALTKAAQLYNGQTQKFGGTAEGSMKKASQAFKEFGETAGKLFLPLLGWLATLGTKIMQLGEVYIKNMGLHLQEFGNLAKGIFDAIVSRDFSKFQTALKANDKLEEQVNRNTTDYWNKSTTEKSKMTVDLSDLKNLKIAKDAATEQKALDELSKKNKALYDEKMSEMEKDTDFLKKTKEEQLSLELKYLEDVLAKTTLNTNDRIDLKKKIADKEKELNKQTLEDTDKTAGLMADSFMAAASNTENAWEKLATKITDTVVTNAFKPMASGLNSMLGQFGDIGTVLSGSVGGVIGSVVSGFLTLLGGQSKSVAEYTKDAYTDMVDKTNDQISKIGQKQTEATKAINLVESMSTGMAPGAKFSDDFQFKQIQAIRATTGINIAGMTSAQALKALYGQAGNLPTEYTVLAAEQSQLQYDLPNLQRVASLMKTKETVTRDPKTGQMVAGTISSADQSWLNAHWGQYGAANANEAQGKVNATIQRLAEINQTVGAAQLDAAQEQVNLASKIASLPKFDVGGVVPGPIGAPVQAIVHGGEKIYPPGKSGDTFIIQAGAFLGTEADAMKFAKFLAYYTKKIDRRNLTV